MVVLCGTVSWRDAGTTWRQASCFQLLPATGCSFLCSISLLEWYWSSHLTFNKKTNCSFKAFLCTPSYWPTVNVGKCVLWFILYQEFLLLLMSGNIKMTHKSSSFVNNKQHVPLTMGWTHFPHSQITIGMVESSGASKQVGFELRLFCQKSLGFLWACSLNQIGWVQLHNNS